MLLVPRRGRVAAFKTTDPMPARWVEALKQVAAEPDLKKAALRK